MNLNETPRASRLTIGIFGRRNAGKSTLFNALCGQQTALVSPHAGTTTDPVSKAVELHGFGPVTFVDTAGLDDVGDLGALRVEKTRKIAEKADLAIFVFSAAPSCELPLYEEFSKRGVPTLSVVNDMGDGTAVAQAVTDILVAAPIPVNARTGGGVPLLLARLKELAPDDFWETEITGKLASDGDTVLLVMPQDIEAPKGRLILPQVQTIRELLDKKCIVLSCTADRMKQTLAALAKPPKLIITDSQAFAEVWKQKPAESLLTSFSILFAGYKGDYDAFRAGAKALSRLHAGSRVLIAEACAHAPAGEDIGRVKIPNLMRKKISEDLLFDFVRGNDFPDDLCGYDLVIHCGACMFTRRHVLGRIAQAQAQDVPICNYGIVLAALNGILDKVCHA